MESAEITLDSDGQRHSTRFTDFVSLNYMTHFSFLTGVAIFLAAALLAANHCNCMLAL
jgi:hypothetical protein